MITGLCLNLVIVLLSFIRSAQTPLAIDDMSASPSFTAGHGGDPEPVQRSNTIHDSESGWEDEDDDMEYQPSTEHSEDIEYFEDDEDDDDGNEEYFG